MKILLCCILISVLTVSAEQFPSDSQPIRIGLALSGGGALGFAHLGVLKVLEREGIQISYITGVSMGSLIGGLYAAGYRTAQIESIAIRANWTTLFSADIPFGARYLPERQQNQRYVFQLRHRNFIPAFPSGLVPLQNVEFLLMRLLSKIEYNTLYEFDSLPIPYRAVAVDLVSGKKTVLKKGRLSQAIRSSIAIPGVFAPKRINGYEYVDGGLIQNLPVDPLLEFNPDFIIASLTMKNNIETGISLIDVVSRSIDLVGIEDLNKQKQIADILIEPNVDKFTHSDFAKAKELIEAGENAARKAIPEIRAKVNNRDIISEKKNITDRAPVIIRSISFEGLKITNENILRNIIQIRKGQYLEFNKLNDDLIKLFNTGFFETVDYQIEFNTIDSIDVIIDLQEKAFGFYYIGVRYDNYDNINLGLEAGQGNLGGSGASVRGVAHLGNPNEFRLGLNGTRLFRLPFGYRLDGYFRSIDRRFYQYHSYFKYNMNYFGGVLETGYSVGRDAFFNFGLNGYKVFNPSALLSFFDTLPANQWIIGPIFNLEFNNHDNLYFPTRGITYRLSGLYSMKKLKASDDFWKLDYFSEQVIPLTSSVLLHPGLEIGISGGRMALAEDFHTGGENLIGFFKDEFTTDQKLIVRLGTDFKLFELFNLSDYPFYLRIVSNVASFKRLDRLIKDIDINTDLNWGVGIGIRTNTPIGPFQLLVGINDFGKPVDYNKHACISLSVGREFRYTKD